MDCGHAEREAAHCLNCDGFLGEVCVYCGDVSDGGDHLASLEGFWCECDDSSWPSDEELGMVDWDDD